MLRIRKPGLVTAVLMLSLATAAFAAPSLDTDTFKGPKANTGHATFAKNGSVRTLTLSPDFVVPDTPAPHWQVVDTQGNTYLLQRLVVKDDKYNQTIELPSYVQNVAKVQIWCAWAEVLLGEASFVAPVM